MRPTTRLLRDERASRGRHMPGRRRRCPRPPSRWLTRLRGRAGRGGDCLPLLSWAAAAGIAFATLIAAAGVVFCDRILVRLDADAASLTALRHARLTKDDSSDPSPGGRLPAGACMDAVPERVATPPELRELSRRGLSEDVARRPARRERGALDEEDQKARLFSRSDGLGVPGGVIAATEEDHGLPRREVLPGKVPPGEPPRQSPQRVAKDGASAGARGQRR